VFRLTDDLALVQTLDFFPPLVDDPFDFGRIAAANALSDVYAMGGVPLTALNLVGFPDEELDWDILAAIMNGGAEVVAQAGAAIIGGHSVRDAEVKYGLSVTGTVHPDRIMTNAAAKVGEKLVLTKPIGSGVLTSAAKLRKISNDDLAEAAAVMAELNAVGRDAMLAHGVHGATDITGFGLLGHLKNIVVASKLSARISTADVPTLDFVRRMADAGMLPGGSKRNLEFVESDTRFAPEVSETDRLILADAQTSGGLLISVPAERETQLCEALERNGTLVQARIGELTSGEPGTLQVDR